MTTFLRLIKSQSILTKDYLQAAKTPLKESFKTMSNVKITSRQILFPTFVKLSLNSTENPELGTTQLKLVI